MYTGQYLMGLNVICCNMKFVQPKSCQAEEDPLNILKKAGKEKELPNRHQVQ